MVQMKLGSILDLCFHSNILGFIWVSLGTIDWIDAPFFVYRLFKVGAASHFHVHHTSSERLLILKIVGESIVGVLGMNLILISSLAKEAKCRIWLESTMGADILGYNTRVVSHRRFWFLIRRRI